MNIIDRPRVLVIAGYDPSGGAGVLADIKTLEANGVYGYAVCTALTFQNEREIRRIQWFSEKDIFEQIDVCFAAAPFEWAKIGITPSIPMAGKIIRYLKERNPSIRVILDPVIRASTGSDFWEGVADDGVGITRTGSTDSAVSRILFEQVVSGCYLLTPNWEEMKWLYPGTSIGEHCRRLTLASGRHLYLKGGHHPEFPGRDYLYSDGTTLVLDPEPVHSGDEVPNPAPDQSKDPAPFYPKHGSGCVLSSALAAHLSMGYPLPVASARAKRYTGQFLKSNKTLLGWHSPDYIS